MGSKSLTGKPRGQCPSCKWWWSLDEKGKLTPHRFGNPKDKGRPHCGGEGMKPLRVPLTPAPGAKPKPAPKSRPRPKKCLLHFTTEIVQFFGWCPRCHQYKPLNSDDTMMPHRTKSTPVGSFKLPPLCRGSNHASLDRVPLTHPPKKKPGCTIYCPCVSTIGKNR